MSTKTIAQLLDARLAASQALQRAEDALREAVIAAAEFKIGDVIRSSNGAEAKIVAVVQHRWRASSAEYQAVLRKKDGTFGRRDASMWRGEWASPQLVERKP